MSTLEFRRSSTHFRLEHLRERMAAEALDGYLVPTADEHLNEYLPPVRERRAWLSGFTGSSGDLLVGRSASWLFVDSRYYEQADYEVEAGAVQVSKLERPGHCTLTETLERLAREAGGFRLGFDPYTLAIDAYRSLTERLRPVGVELVAIRDNLVDSVRLALGESVIVPVETPLFTVPIERCGQSVAEKLAAVREAMSNANADILPITRLDQVAWLFNLRGWDIPYNPVFTAYALITAHEAYLFTAEQRIDEPIRAQLSGVTVLPYADYAGTLSSLVGEWSRVLIDIQRTTVGTLGLLGSACIVEAQSPVEKLKAHKNTVELAQMQLANLKASRAKVRTLHWLASRIVTGRTSEQDVALTIESFYREDPDCRGLSFNTIAAAGANSSVVHYSTPSPEVFLHSGSLLLLDSGAQYLAGTTDDTRTVAIGVPTTDQVLRYTEVLKAHINCALQRFPKGTTGAQLDGITRYSLWLAGLDYGHGTGHGVGAFLNVHEGPAGLNRRALVPLAPGMITSIEPGYYLPGWGGIRIENLYTVQTLESDDGSLWYGFEPLTYIPFARRLIDVSRLEPRQRQWLSDYYQVVLTKLVPLLDREEMDWLRAECDLEL